MIEGSKYCSDVAKNDFNKELVMTKEDHEDFKNSAKCWICDNDYIDNDVGCLTLVGQHPMKSLSPICLSVRPSTCPYVHPSITKFSQDWIISFF